MFRGISIACFALLLANTPAAPAAAVVQVVATVPDLADLTRTVGGEHVEVLSLTKGPQDPHIIEPRPSFVRALHRADLLVAVGMDLEVGWLPPLLERARNSAIRPGAVGYLDASAGIQPLQVPGRGADRSLGDLHPFGNPHYLVDPLNGLRVSEALRDRLIELAPDHAAAFRGRQAAFARQLLERLVGAELVAAYPPQVLAGLIEEGGTPQGTAARIDGEVGGWFAALAGAAGTEAVEEHRAWVYLARRTGLVLVATLEPFDGVAPTTRHLTQVVELMERDQVPLLLSSAYFDPRHARWVADRTGARIVPLAHQVDARPGVRTYLELVDYNLGELSEALRSE